MKKFTMILMICAVLSPFAVTAARANEAEDLKMVLEKQEQILKSLEEVKSELQIVKVRVSSS